MGRERLGHTLTLTPPCLATAPAVAHLSLDLATHPPPFSQTPPGRRVAKVSHSSQTAGASPSLPGSPDPALIFTDSPFITLPPRKPLGTPSVSCWSPDKPVDLGTASWQPTLGDGRCLQELRQGEGRATPTSAKGQHALGGFGRIS